MVTDEAWTEYIVGERHECGWVNVRLPELKGLMDENQNTQRDETQKDKEQG